MLEITLKKRQGAFDVDVDIRTGSGVTALFGRSGAGKTSVVAMVAGLRHPDSGRIVAGGRVLYDSATRLDLPPERRRVGYVFQDSRLFPHLSVLGNLTYGQKLVPAAERYVDLEQVVDLLGIASLLDRRPASLSGGEKQRVAIGRALLTSPSLLLMDEPLASLDGARKAEVLPFIARLPRELSVPILYVSHSLDEVLKLADHLVLLDAGRVAASGSVEAVMSEADLGLLTGQDERGAVISATVRGQEPESGSTLLDSPAGPIRVRALAAGPGTPVRVRVTAREVALALEMPQGLSVQNRFTGVVREIHPVDAYAVDVRLDVGCTLWARITAHALADLDLRPGQTVVALLKSLSIPRGGVAEHGPGY